MQRPFMRWLLIIVLFSFAFGGFSDGIPMLADFVDGGYLQFVDHLRLLLVTNLIMPGFFLLIVMSLFPVFLAYGFIARSEWTWLDQLFQWSKPH